MRISKLIEGKGGEEWDGGMHLGKNSGHGPAHAQYIAAHLKYHHPSVPLVMMATAANVT